MVREELSAEKTAEQILNAVKAEPWRYLRREHSSRGKEVGGTLACWWGGRGGGGRRPTARTGGVGREEPEEQLCWDKQAGPGHVGPGTGRGKDLRFSS